MFKGNIDAEGKLFGWNPSSDHVKFLLRAIAMHDCWCDAARETCVAWILVAKRTGLNKDVRKIIARLVWEARREGRGDLAVKKQSDHGQKCSLM